MADGLARLVADLRISANIPPPATNFRTMEDGLANIYVFEIRPPIGNNRTLVYRYDVEIKEAERDKSLTKPTGDDGKRGLLREICFQLLQTVHNNTNAFNTNGQAHFVYDNRKILYTNIRVNPLICQITPEEMNPYCRQFLNNAIVNFEMQPCDDTAAHELDLNDLSRALQTAPHQQADHSLRQFFEMLTSQPFINDGTHTPIGAGRLFEKREYRRLNDLVCAHRGIAKGVRIVVNGDVKPCPAMVTDVKTCAFYVSGNLETIANGMINTHRNRRRLNTNNPKEMESFWNDFGHIYKGISAYLTYNPSRVIVIDSITQRNCGEISFNIDGRNTSMVEFYRAKNENINPNMPAVRQHVDRDSVYPLKCLVILPFQRVTLDKMSLNDDMLQISSELLKENATAPEVRYAAIETEMRRLGAEGDCAKFMRQFNVRLRGGRNDVQLGMLTLPNIRFGHSDQQQDNKGRFDILRGPMKYLEPSKLLKSWVVANPRKISQDQIRQFIGNLMQTGRQRGMEIPNPEYELMELNQLDERMRQLGDRKVNFLVYIDNKYVKSHFSLKLLERRFNVLTQHLTIEMVSKARGASISNVLNKMNMKLFGQNYVPIFNPASRAKFDLTSGKVLVIGIDTSRPPRATAFEKFKLKKAGLEGLSSEEPMVVGFCANYLPNPIRFVGDYYYQPCCQDVLNSDYLYEKMEWMFNQMKVAKRQPPATIFVIRDGVSEGMVPNLLRNEYDAFVEACRRFQPGWKPNFVYCIVDKRHNKRFFQNAHNGNGNGRNGNGNGNGAVAQNTMPGTVVDRKFVRVDMHEFFLQAHYPLKGVSKIPQYVFPVNDVKADNNELQAFLHGLCNMWQIVNLAPALPTPVLQAKELAKRGRNNFCEFKRNHTSMVPYAEQQPQQQQGNQPIRMLNYEKLNKMLNYEGEFLVKTRFNA